MTIAGTTPENRFLLCVNSTDYPTSLEVRKVYAALPDPAAESTGFVRVIDESGEDYLYPQALFIAIKLPQAAVDEVLTAAGGGTV